LTTNANPDFDDEMNTKQFILTICGALVPITMAFAASADEKAVRDADEAWSKAAGTRDLDKIVSYYADDAIVLPPNEATVTTKEGIRKMWQGLLDSGGTISWTATRVEVAKSGDMAVTTGTYELAMKDGTKDHGKYCEVWEKKAGTWKAATDMFSSDQPCAPPTSTAPTATEK
jgi:ketosteroid isomerase-like protein